MLQGSRLCRNLRPFKEAAKSAQRVAAYDAILEAIAAKEAKNVRLSEFISLMRSQKGVVSEFNIRLWSSTVEFVTVGRDKDITVTFRDGTEIIG